MVSTAKEYCKVAYAYKATNEDELTLNEGDIVHVLSKVSFQVTHAVNLCNEIPFRQCLNPTCEAEEQVKNKGTLAKRQCAILLHVCVHQLLSHDQELSS